MTSELTQAEYEALSAYCDGELAVDEAAAIQRRIAEDPAWRQAHEEFTALDEAMDTWTVPPVGAGLDQRVIVGVREATRPTPLVFRVLAGFVSGAAAATLLVGIILTARPEPVRESYHASVADVDPNAIDPHGQSLSRLEALVEEKLKDVPADDRSLVENLDFVEDYEVVTNYEVLEALDRLMPSGT